MNKYILAALSVCGGLLCGVAWTDWCPGIILLIAFMPFLIIEDYLYESRKHYTHGTCFLLFLPGFVIFSLLTFGWIRALSIVAALCVILISGFLMTSVVWLSHLIRLRTGSLKTYTLALISFWLAFEFLCLRINLFSPWINLGNGLSKEPILIQWYEITGVAGGTLWILLSNILLFTGLINVFRNGKYRILLLSLWFFVAIIPPLLSIIRYRSIKVSDLKPDEAVIIQPNADPYGDKFTVPFNEQLEKALSMASSSVTYKTDWLVMPETLIDDPVNENLLNENKYIQRIKEFSRQNPGITVVLGMVSTLESGTDNGNNFVSDRSVHTKIKTQYFNSAFKIDTGPVIQIYHKSKLVPGFEFIPSGALLKLISALLPESGTRGGYSTEGEKVCLLKSDSSEKIAPVICYESLYGESLAQLVRLGAGAVFIITNDGWWKNTNGYKRHLDYSSIRAIETRRPIVRAANTGVSCFVDIRGHVTSRTSWWKPETLKGNFTPESRITPYVRYGDYLMRLSLFMSVIILVQVFLIARLVRK